MVDSRKVVSRDTASLTVDTLKALAPKAAKCGPCVG